MKAGIVFMAFATVAIAFAQTGQQAKQSRILELARKGDDSALSEMEKSGDTQDLQTLFHDPGYAGKASVRLSLARMGDSEVLQYYACRSLTDDVSHIDDLMRQDLDHIGGDFTVEVYRHLLDSDPRFRPQIERLVKEHGGDSWPMLPSVAAILRLSRLVPNSPVPELRPIDIQAHPGIDEEFKSKWRTWIDAHQVELQKLKPDARRVNFDTHYCSQSNDTSRH